MSDNCTRLYFIASFLENSSNQNIRKLEYLIYIFNFKYFLDYHIFFIKYYKQLLQLYNYFYKVFTLQNHTVSTESFRELNTSKSEIIPKKEMRQIRKVTFKPVPPVKCPKCNKNVYAAEEGILSKNCLFNTRDINSLIIILFIFLIIRIKSPGRWNKIS